MFFSTKSYLRVRIALAGVMAVIFAFAPLFSIQDAWAVIPQTINYQSRLLTPGGLPVTSTTAIQLSFYFHPTNGASGDVPAQAGPLVWKEVYDQPSGACSMITPDAKGYFFLKLGSCTPFPSYLDFSEVMYVGVKIGADAEASPRVQLSSHPYALNAYRLNGFEATSTATANQLLALDNNLNFNIATGTFTGAGLFINGTSTLQEVTFTVATGTSLNLTQYLAIGAIRLDSVGTNNQTSGAYLVGVFDEFVNSNATTVQAALFDLDTAITTVSSTLYAMDLQLVTDNGNITTNWIEFAGGTSTGDIIPGAHDTYSLGTTDLRWSNLWSSVLHVGTSTWDLAQADNGAFTIGQNAGSERMRILTNGAVGIGTVAPSTLLHVQGGQNGSAVLVLDSVDGNNFGHDAGITINADNDNGSDAAFIQFFNNNIFSGTIYGSHSEMSFYLPANRAFNFSSGGSSRMHITNTGDVGIATMTAQYRLDVVGDVRLTSQFMLGQYAINPISGNQAGAMIYNTVSSTPFFWDGTEWIRFANIDDLGSYWSLSGNLATDPLTDYLGTTDNQPLVFRTNAIERMRLSANGYLGLGTSSPTSLIYVQGGAVGDAILTLNSDDGSGSGVDAGIIINSDNNNGSDASNIKFYNNGRYSTKLTGSDNRFSIWMPTSTSEFQISSGFDTRLFMDGSGNFGFSTETPAYRVDIIGDARVSAQFMLGQYAVNPVIGNQSGTMIYNTADLVPYYWDGSSWIAFATGTNLGPLDLQDVTNYGNVTTNAIQFAGGTSTASLEVTGELSINGIKLNTTGIDGLTSGAYLVGTFDEFANFNATTVQAALKAIDAMLGSSSASSSVFVGLTAGFYDGAFNYGGKIGYQAANDICANQYSGSHFCRTDEIIATIAAVDISALFMATTFGWIAEGPPGYTANSNDCAGYTTNSNTDLGAFWAYDPNGGGMGWLNNCQVTRQISCCR